MESTHGRRIPRRKCITTQEKVWELAGNSGEELGEERKRKKKLSKYNVQ